jgi:hypothetical protein
LFTRRRFNDATTITTALRKLCENHHAKDATALRKLYQHHAEDCGRMAALTVDPQRREDDLTLASGWTEAAAALGASKH